MSMPQIMEVPVFVVNGFSGINSSENTVMSIGTRLKEARKDAKLSQEDLAKVSGVSKSSISDLERGKSAGTTSLAMLANACRVNALWLETGRGVRSVDASPKPREDSPHDRIERLNEAEAEIIQLFRQATPNGRRSIRAAAVTCEKF